MDTKDRQNKMARLVFHKDNLKQLKDGLNALFNLYAEVLDKPFEQGTCFTHDDILAKLQTIDQQKWRHIRNMFLLDHYYGYCNGDFSEEENMGPAKLMLDVVNIFDQIGSDLKTQLENYQHIIWDLTKEKTDLEINLTKTEALFRESRAFTTQDKTDLKTARATVAYLEGVIREKNEKIAQLQREQNVQLWEREKGRVFQQKNIKIRGLETELQEIKRVNETLNKKIVQMGESNKILKMKQDVIRGIIPPSNVKSIEDLKRAIYLLEKDVLFLEQQLYNQQRTFAAVLGGLKTDLIMVSDNLNDSNTGQVDLRRVCDVTQSLYKAMLVGDLTVAQKTIPPHYSHIPNEFKIGRIKRVSKPKISIKADSDDDSGLPPESQTSVAESDRKTSNEVKSNQSIAKEETIVENPSLIDPVSRTVNSIRCMQYFPHMSIEFVKDHWSKFQEFDIDGNGSLDFGEVVKALTSVGLQFTAKQAEEAMHEVDINKSKTLDFYEYLLVADKLFSNKGHSEMFHMDAAKENRKVIAKTCILQ